MKWEPCPVCRGRRVAKLGKAGFFTIVFLTVLIIGITFGLTSIMYFIFGDNALTMLFANLAWPIAIVVTIFAVLLFNKINQTLYCKDCETWFRPKLSL